MDILNETDDCLSKSQGLRSGIFWVISDDIALTAYKLLVFEIPCDLRGNPTGAHILELNSKSGNTYNHNTLWESEVKNNHTHRLYNRKPYNHYPRGRVEISNNRATIYLNPHINQLDIIDEIKLKFGLSEHNISETRVVVDGSVHYKCFIDFNN